MGSGRGVKTDPCDESSGYFRVTGPSKDLFLKRLLTFSISRNQREGILNPEIKFRDKETQQDKLLAKGNDSDVGSCQGLRRTRAGSGRLRLSSETVADDRQPHSGFVDLRRQDQ